MIVALIVASLAAGTPASARPVRLPCQAVPALCLKPGREDTFRITSSPKLDVDGKMSAYGFDARPCRIIGNLDCAKRANRTLLQLGEPVEDTLLHSFGLR